MIINQGVTVTATGAQAYTATNAKDLVTIGIYGSLIHVGVSAIDLASDNSSVVIGATGAIQSLELPTFLTNSIRLSGAFSNVRNNGTIVSSDVGIKIEGTDNTIFNAGTLSGATALYSTAANTNITNSGAIYGYVTGVILAGTGGQLHNSGEISSTRNAISASNGSYISNTGTIVSNSNSPFGYSAIEVSGLATIRNDGLISSAGYAVHTFGLTGQVNLSNTGHITSSNSLFLTVIDVGFGLIDNSGEIAGDISFTNNAQSSQITNSGTILGDVHFSNGGGTFVDIGGKVSGNIFGGAGSDLFWISDSGITISDASGLDFDQVNATVSYTLGGGIEALQLLQNAVVGAGNGQDNTVSGNAMANILSGLAGADVLMGNTGGDSLFGGQDNDQLFGGDEDDVLNGGGQDDQLSGDDGNDNLRGGTGNDLLDGVADDDVLTGGNGNDTLNGGDGADILTGGTGRDVMYGGADADVFVFSKGDSTKIAATRDVISGFVTGVDSVDLSKFDANVNNANANDTFAFLGSGIFTAVAGQLHFVISGANIVLEGDTNGDSLADFQIQLNGIASIAIGDLVL